MSSDGGVTNRRKLAVIATLGQAKDLTGAGESAFAVQPAGRESFVTEARVTHVRPKTMEAWEQYKAGRSDQGSTAYENFLGGVSVTDVTRANKALVKGAAGKKYGYAGQVAATLFRINEPYTAFGAAGLAQTKKDVGAGIMAEVLKQKWDARKLGAPDPEVGLAALRRRYPQLIDADRAVPATLTKQIASSRLEAASSAEKRAAHKKIEGEGNVRAYVAMKFERHGLGAVPGDWAPTLKRAAAAPAKREPATKNRKQEAAKKT